MNLQKGELNLSMKLVPKKKKKLSKILCVTSLHLLKTERKSKLILGKANQTDSDTKVKKKKSKINFTNQTDSNRKSIQRGMSNNKRNSFV